MILHTYKRLAQIAAVFCSLLEPPLSSAQLSTSFNAPSLMTTTDGPFAIGRNEIEMLILSLWSLLGDYIPPNFRIIVSNYPNINS